MHLHGHHFTVVAVNGERLKEPWLVKNTLHVGPMESYEIEFVADNPGDWLFHCHQAHHADNGLVVLIKYE
jgi:FtsP/CotA-like multicopper oxidase with cupredoxin domain